MTIYTRRVRWYQVPLYKHLVEVQNCHAIEIAHRRWGKDETVLGATNERMHKRVGTYWHCLPQYGQARKAIWEAINGHTGKRRIDEAFPPETRKRTLNDEMFIELHNGSTWQCIGSDSYDKTVGAGPVFIAYSEWALCNPAAWAYHRPMIEETNGGAVFITTPRGKNHAYDMYQRNKKRMIDDPRYYAGLSSISDTNALTPEQLQEALDEYIDLYGAEMGRSMYEQEYECSFVAATLGVLYGKEMREVRNEGRIDPTLEAIPGKPVHRAWDLGVKDDTAIWWFQIVGTQIYVLDCYSVSGVSDIAEFAKEIRERNAKHGWEDGVDYVPHDARQRVWGMKKGRLETMQEEGLKPQVVMQMSVLDGINAARRTLPRCIFHERCEEQGIAALENYHRKWDPDKKVLSKNPDHDWSSHLADAFRYLALAWQEEYKPPVKVQLPVASQEITLAQIRKQRRA